MGIIAAQNWPREYDGKCSWRLPKELRENEGLAVLGNLQSILNAGVRSCSLDLGDVEWIDPQPLLCLGLLLAESGLQKRNIEIELGSTQASSAVEHRIFLKFFSQQGFLAAFAQFVRFRCDRTLVEGDADLRALRLRLAAEPKSTHIKNADCIHARLLRVDAYQSDPHLLQDQVEALLLEAQERAIGSAFGPSPTIRDMLFQKVRKLLYELLLNAAEHAHPGRIPTYAGVYARVRGARPAREAESSEWSRLFRADSYTFGNSQFNPNPFAGWLELFICDVGEGLTSQIKKWQEPSDPLVAADLKKAQQSDNPLQSIAYRLFSKPLSRHDRHNVTRTAVTGLQHLGHLLSINGDHCRLYTQQGSWVGGSLPWKDGSFSHADIRPKRRNAEAAARFEGLTLVSGTAYVFAIQPSQRGFEQGQDSCVVPSADDSVRIRAVLQSASGGPSASVLVVDKRNDNNCAPPMGGEFLNKESRVVVLRPPRLMSKLDVSRWLELFVEHCRNHVGADLQWVLADLTPFQMFAIRELLLNVVVGAQTDLRVVLVSEDWRVTCVATSTGSRALKPSMELSREFIKASEGSFRLMELALILRELDSEIFWKSVELSIPQPFFNGPVDWPSSRNAAPIRLSRYLDFPVALADPVRYRACRRALRRLVALYPDHSPVAADDLVASLVRDANRGLYREERSHERLLVVGSVAVTGGTVARFSQGAAVESVHILTHEDAQFGDQPAPLAALLWLRGPLRTHGEQVQMFDEPWKRITNTAYIAPHGEQSISLLRYQRTSRGALDFSNPFYGRTPEEMYNDFARLGAIKTGHWKYGSLHDLITINLRQATLFSFLELGPMYEWLKAQFRDLFVRGRRGQSKAQILVYPSHPVTDALMDRIRQDPGFAELLPSGGMMPITFLGNHTVSPLLASHLVAYQIKQKIALMKLKSWSVTVLDDGAVTGKHLRELSQLIRDLKPSRVFTIALLDRTGLPAYERVLKEFTQRNRRYWRWDVPALGNGRDCQICKALTISQTYSTQLLSERQRARLREWSSLWQARDIDTEWHEGGMQAVPFAEPLRVTFGVDDEGRRRRNEKSLYLSNSTLAASVVLELMRLTTRADVALKKARAIAQAFPDAASEFISLQFILFLDELTLEEMVVRLLFLLGLIWERPLTTQATSLAALCVTLADREVLKALWPEVRDGLLSNRPLGNLDAMLAANIVVSRYSNLTGRPYELTAGSSDVERQNYILLGGTSGVRQVVREFLVCYRNPAAPDTIDTHNTELRARLARLEKLGPTSTGPECTLSCEAVKRDIELVRPIVSRLVDKMVVETDATFLDGLDQASRRLSEALRRVPFEKPGAMECATRMSHEATSLFRLLYGSGSTDVGGLQVLASQFLQFFKGSEQVDRDLVAPIERAVRSAWDEIVRAKATSPQYEQSTSRWMSGEQIRKPVIRSALQPSQGELWIYCDTFVRKALDEVIRNVYYSAGLIPNPWSAHGYQGDLAHMWWRAMRSGNYAEFTFTNLTANREISLKQTVNIAGLERAGGRVQTAIKDGEHGTVAHVILLVPLHTAFFEEG